MIYRKISNIQIDYFKYYQKEPLGKEIAMSFEDINTCFSQFKLSENDLSNVIILVSFYTDEQ